MTAELEVVYSVDTSALIDLGRWYPRSVFRKLWQEMKVLVTQGRLIAPPQVREEIKRQDDELLRWVRAQKRMFVQLQSVHLQCVSEILGHFPDLIDPNKQTEDADPFVIAVALARKRGHLFGSDYVVVTQERLRSHGRPRIPNVCQHYGIECLDIFQFFAREGWTF